MSNIRPIFYIFVVIILVVYANFMFPKKSLAVLGFGAPIILTTPCTNGIMITIGPLPSSGNYLVSTTPPSKIYAYGSIKPGSWVLGTYSPGGACLVPPAAPIPVLGTVIIMGTSK